MDWLVFERLSENAKILQVSCKSSETDHEIFLIRSRRRTCAKRTQQVEKEAGRQQSARPSQHCSSTRINPRSPLWAEVQLHQVMPIPVSSISCNSLLASAFSQFKGKIWPLFLVSNRALMLCLSLELRLVYGIERAAGFPQLDLILYQAVNYRTHRFQPRSAW